MHSEAPGVSQLNSPEPVLADPGSKSSCTPQHSFFRMGPMLVTAFHSPRTATAFAVSIPGSTFPTCHFANLPAASTARSVSNSATDPGLPQNLLLHCRKPVAALAARSPDCCPSFHSPS